MPASTIELSLKVKVETVLPLIPCSAPPVMFRLARLAPVTVCKWIAAFVNRLSPVERPELSASRSLVPALVKFMLLSEMFEALANEAPRLAVF